MSVPVSYDPVLLRKVAQIYTETDDALRLALERAVAVALSEWKPIDEVPRLLALANEFGCDAVVAALREVQQIRLEALEKVFSKVHRKLPPSSSSSAERDEHDWLN